MSIKYPDFLAKSLDFCKKRACLWLSSVFYIFLILAAVYIFSLGQAPEDFPKQDTIVSIIPGTSIEDAGKILEKEKIIRNSKLFSIWTRFRYGEIKAGDYMFKSPETLWTVSKRLAHGAHGLVPVKVLIKEGDTRVQIANKFAEKLYNFNPDKFLLLTEGKEGFLFPDTYIFLPNASEEEVAGVLLDNFNKKIEKYAEDIEKSKMSLQDIITLASLVEREARNDKDRKMIAGVLLNRLRIGMPLQVDVTWFYTHGKGTPGITLKELSDKDNPYNTYVHKGLPPSPIGSPGISSIEAVLFPTKSNYLFYLADKQGRTYFSKSYQEHLEKRNKYIKGQY